MKAPQTRMIYRPKKEGEKTWQAESIDLSSYIDHQVNVSIEKKEDASQLTFVNKILSRGSITSYDTGTHTFTVSNTNMEVNQFRWCTDRKSVV